MFISRLLLSVLVLGTVSASALDVEVNLSDVVYGPAINNPTVYLAKALEKQRPDIARANYYLESVVLVAKSQYGGGSATLRVDGARSEKQTVPGKNADWKGAGENTFYSLSFSSPKGPDAQSAAAWQVAMTGNVKVRRAILSLRDRPAAPPQQPFVNPGRCNPQTPCCTVLPPITECSWDYSLLSPIMICRTFQPEPFCQIE